MIEKFMKTTDEIKPVENLSDYMIKVLIGKLEESRSWKFWLLNKLPGYGWSLLLILPFMLLGFISGPLAAIPPLVIAAIALTDFDNRRISERQLEIIVQLMEEMRKTKNNPVAERKM